MSFSLLVIVTRLFDCGCNNSNLVISLSIIVHVDVARGITNDPTISSYVRPRLGEE